MIGIIPPQYRILAGLVLIVCAVCGSALGGWYFRDLKADAQVASIHATHSAEREKQATAALTTLKADVDLVRQAATEYAAIETTLAPKIAALTKELRNAPKLPPGCVPDAYRVRNLDAAIDAANQSIPR